MARTLPADTLPPAPGSTALAGASTQLLPAVSTASCVVSKATSPAVIHTVPAGMEQLLPPGASTEKRSRPSAFPARFLSSPRRAA